VGFGGLFWEVGMERGKGKKLNICEDKIGIKPPLNMNERKTFTPANHKIKRQASILGNVKKAGSFAN